MPESNIRIYPSSVANLKKKKLNLPLIYQVQSEWCWAACANMVLRFCVNAQNSNCDIVNWLLNQTNCCSASNSISCNRNCQWADIEKIYTHWNITCTQINDNIPFNDIITEIDNNRPVQIGYQWDFGGGHVVVAIGYNLSSDNKQYVYLNDPIRGHGWYLYTNIINAGGKGKWVYTWKNVKKNN